MKTTIVRLDLGMSRIAGFTVYDDITKEFQEKTPKEITTLIKKNELNGLKLVNNKIELDTEGFNMKNLMIKSGVGKFRKMHETDTIINCMYAVVRVIKFDDNTVYEVINNRCARIKIDENRIKMLYEIGYVAGIILVKNRIDICKGVTIEDRRNKKCSMQVDEAEKIKNIQKKK